MNSCISEIPGPEVQVKAIPAGAHDDPDGGDLVLGLDDRVARLAGLGVDAQILAVAGEGLSQRGGGRDRVPGADRGAAVDRAQGGRRVALHEDAVAHRVGAAHLQADRGQVRRDVIAAHVQRLDIGADQPLLAGELLGQQGLDDGEFDVQQRRERTDVNDVLEQLPLARDRIDRVADLGQRHADDRDVLAELRRRHGLGGIVEQVAARLDLGHVAVPGLRVHRHHQVDAAAAPQTPRLRDAHLEPGRQALDVGREDVARRDRHAHAQDRLGEHAVGAGRSGPVHIGEFDDEVVRTL
jgi:hypothetical protein